MKILETDIDTKKISLSNLRQKDSTDVKTNLDLEFAKKYVFKYIQSLNICTKKELLRFYHLTNTILDIFDKDVICDGLATLCYQYETALNLIIFSISANTMGFNTSSCVIANKIKEKTRYYDIEVKNDPSYSIEIELRMKVFNSDIPEINDEVISNFNNLLK